MTENTEQKAQERIEQSYESQRQAIMDSLPVVITLLDEDGKYLEIITGEHNQLYRSKDELLGKRLHDVFPTNIADTFHDAIAKTLEQNKVNTLEYELDVIKGHAYFTGRLSPMDYEVDGKRVILFLAIDVTEQKNKDIQLQHSMKMNAVGQLTGGIAHNFNNLLSIIIGNLDYLKSRTQNDEQAQSLIQRATAATSRGSILIKQLLTFTHHQNGEVMIVNINKIIRMMDTLISCDRSTPVIEVEHNLDEKLWLTQVDPGEFENIFLNIILNAYHAMPAGGTLAIETSNIILKEGDVKDKNAWLTGEYVLLNITDTGCGMSQEVKDKALEPFFTTRDVGKGSGLGLSVVYGFMRSLNGYIDINSELDKGTSIKLYLPRILGKEDSIDEPSNTSAKADATKTKNSKAGNANEETILIVDDEVGLRDLAQEQIESLGYKVYAASNGEEALQLLGEHKDIDLMFSDVIMPGSMNGYELAVKAMQLRPDLKLLMASGFTVQAMKQKDLVLIDAEVLNKPYRYEELTVKLREVLDT